MNIGKNYLIISLLRQNARETLTNISKKTKIPISTLYDKIKSKNEGTILRHTSLLNFGELGYFARANIMIRGRKEEKDILKEHLLNHFNVNSLYKINNGYDFLMECVFKNLKEVEDFIEKLESDYGIEETKIHYIIDDLKREEFMANPAFLDLVI
jgi:DNA-binding Lrp family transcriptional regulator